MSLTTAQIPLPTAPHDVESTLSSDTSDAVLAASMSSLHLRLQARDRNSILTIGSVATTLPRYSRIDFSDLNDSVEQVEHSTSENNSNTAVLTGPEVTFQHVDPPTYTASYLHRSNFVLHRFHIVGGLTKVLGFRRSSKREPWATVKLLSRRPLPGSKKNSPRFIGGDVLQGSVDLRSDALTNIHSIELVLKGKAQVEKFSTTYPEISDHTFLDKSYSIYSKKISRESNGAVQSPYSIPFSIPFPTFVEWRYSTSEKALQDAQAWPVITYEAPPSIRENRLASAAVYELDFVITHGTLKTRTRTTTEIVYIPRKVSPPASEKRQATYREAALLPGPSADPDGWHALPPVIVRGKYQYRTVIATCILNLAKPLSFTRGTTIPCFLSLSCLDAAFLEALASPHTANVRLIRKIGHSAQSSAIGKEGESTGGAKIHIAWAVWWKPPKTDTPLDLNERCLEGEVHLPKSLVSSCDFPLFTIEYTMELLPFTLSSFMPTHEVLTSRVNRVQEPKNASLEPMIQQTVDITNFHEFGPVPVAFSTQVADEKQRQDPSWPNVSDGSRILPEGGSSHMGIAYGRGV